MAVVTPMEALDEALRETFTTLHTRLGEPAWSDQVASVKWELAVTGHVVARTEHARDGAALAALREALPYGFFLTVEQSYHDRGGWLVTAHEPEGVATAEQGEGPTIADAADACRAALEARS